MNILLKLDESTKTCAPDHFVHLVEKIQSERSNLLKVDKTVLEMFSLENDYAMCVLLTVAIECGFRLNRSKDSKDFDYRVCKEVNFASKWRDATRRLYTTDLYLANLKDTRFVLLVVPVLGNVLIVNILTMMNRTVSRTNVEPLIPSQWLSLFQQTIPERFNNLPLFARTVHRFFQREKDIALNAIREPNPSLLGIPDELIRNIIYYISARDFVNLTATCKHFKRYKKDTMIWKYFVKRDFKYETDEPFEFYVSRFCSLKSKTPSYPDFTDHIYPLMLHRTTSSTSLQDYHLI